jgi:predicted  nucleic acid-binding Zn-ribbon protein
VKNFFRRLLSDYNKEVKIIIRDNKDEEKYSLSDFIGNLLERVEILEDKYSGLLEDVKRLEEENVELTNSLYEVENRLESKIYELIKFGEKNDY